MTVIQSQARTETLGQVFALVIGLVALGVCGFLVVHGAPVWGMAVLIGEIAVLVGSFVWINLRKQSGRDNSENTATENVPDLMEPPSPTQHRTTHDEAVLS